VKPQVRIVAGARAGHIEVFSKDAITVGRHPASDIALDADRDLRSSARHATIVHRGGAWYVRDEQSRNGTFVNGHRITGETKLDDTDQISIGGEGGPVLEIRMVPDGTPDGVTASAASGPPPTAIGSQQGQPARQRATTPAPRPAKPSTTERIRVEVGKQTKVLRHVVVGLLVVVVAAAAGVYYMSRQQAAERASEMAAIQARTDSILATAATSMAALQDEVEGLGTMLQESQGQVASLQNQLSAAERAGRTEEAEELKAQLAEATTTLTYQQTAAQVDYRSLVEANRFAIALVWVEFAPGEVYTGTAFAVREDGTLITNRHVVRGPDGTRQPSRIAVKFEDSRQVWPAQLLTTSSEVDLAVIRVNIAGGVPTVRGLNVESGDVFQGDPVAVIGFPLGTELPMSGAGADAVAKTSFSAGTVSKVLPDLIQIDGYGAEGASGSPIFDRNGEVIAVLYGGQAGTGGRIVFGVPTSYVVDLLQTIN
jgi:S1-C subfamily serine protease